MQLVTYDPFNIQRIAEKDMQKLFGGEWLWPAAVNEQSPVDMYVENDKAVVEVALPNFKKEELKVTAGNHSLEITAEHQEKTEKNSKRRYMLCESKRSFYRRIALPQGAEAGKAKAAYTNGKLSVTMPFKEGEQSKEVLVT